MPLVDITMPQLGQSVSEGLVVKWLKKPGDTVARDEGVVAISTDKAEAEVPAPAAGRLVDALVAEGTTVEVGTVLGRMEATSPGKVAPAPTPAATPVVSTPAKRATSGPANDDRFLSPAIRTLLRERGVDMAEAATIPGSGRNGRLTLEDVTAWLDERIASPVAASTPTPGGADYQIVPLTGMRALIAEHMLAAKRSIPHVNTVAEIDMSGVVASRRAHGPAFQERHGINLSFNAFLLKAVATSLVEFPGVNAVVDERGIVQHARVHLGMAVALEPSGLVVPVVRDAHLRSVTDIAIESERLAQRARKRQLLPDEMAGGTCTVTNPGVFGNEFGMPIIHAPQAAIVDFGAIKKRPVVVSDDHGDSIAIRPTCYVVLAWDHRAMDGATAAKFLQRLVRELESVRPSSPIA